MRITALKLALAVGFLLSLTACHRPSYLGYVEGRLTYLSSPVGGRLTALSAQRGQSVKAGDPLFQLQSDPETYDVQTALATVNQITADLADKMKGQRPSELQATSAQMAQAQAQVEYAKKDLARKQELVKKNAVEQYQLDQATENLKIAEASLQQVQANLVTGKLSAREDQIKALQAQLENAKGNLARAQWNLQQKSITAPVNAKVFDTYYRVGEQVAPNQPVLSILAPNDIKVIFFVDEPSLSSIKIGQKVQVKCDHCQSGITAKITYISPSAEFTPPIIYSRSARSKLVYEVEAGFDSDKVEKKGIQLNPGEPVEVFLE